MMKNFSMNKVLGTIKKKPTIGATGVVAEDSPASVPAPSPNSTPEVIAAFYVKQFCQSGGSHSGDDVTYLPPIVEAAESSPAAAAECARYIRKFLYREYWSRPSHQYNAIMLIRILSDNPGPTFTRNMDKKFVDAAKDLLRSGRDGNVRQMLMETLDSFENAKGYDEGLGLIIEMWKKEKEKAYKAYGGRPHASHQAYQAPGSTAAPNPHSQNYFSRAHSNKTLPNAVELANRLEEARTSAGLLEQVVACTPPSEVLSNDLIREFADRCLSASRSIQGYMTAENPAPDNDTMESLIDTNEQLQQALNHHQRAMLNAKKQLGLGERSNDPSPSPPSVNDHTRPHQTGGPWQPPAVDSASSPQPPRINAPPIPSRKGNGKGKATADMWDTAAAAGPSRSSTGTPRHDEDDPFRDPQPESSASSARRVAGGSGPGSGGGGGGAGGSDDTPRYAYEPFHPGFGSSALQHKDRDGGAPPDPVTPVSDDGMYDENDAYRATPPSKKSEPVYRF
ncbi:hypothetical protein B0T17DRAFT_543225 [Bombardia bombarda]|uniref:GAT domain-containing protein n=1 Tax=Bombardia bombarda TaxID=252184 RepID=A0AA39WAN7_9PEZI|nr:hypothetical protein B0T17DRAFT_543225 [Bombardia bombarda]